MDELHTSFHQGLGRTTRASLAPLHLGEQSSRFSSSGQHQMVALCESKSSFMFVGHLCVCCQKKDLVLPSESSALSFTKFYGTMFPNKRPLTKMFSTLGCLRDKIRLSDDSHIPSFVASLSKSRGFGKSLRSNKSWSFLRSAILAFLR